MGGLEMGGQTGGHNTTVHIQTWRHKPLYNLTLTKKILNVGPEFLTLILNSRIAAKGRLRHKPLYNLTLTKKIILNVGPEFITLILNPRIAAKGRLFACLVLGLGILDYPLNLTQCLCNDMYSCIVPTCLPNHLEPIQANNFLNRLLKIFFIWITEHLSIFLLTL